MTSLLIVVGGFASGVFLRSLFVFSWPVVALVLVVAGIFAVTSLLYKQRGYGVIALFLVLLASGAFRTQIADAQPPISFTSALGTEVSYTGVVVSDPDMKDASQRIPILVTENKEMTKILAVANRYPAVAVGDTVSLSGILALPQPFSSENEGGRIFRYDKFLEKDGTRFLIQNASVVVRAEAPWYSLGAFFARVKHAFLSGLSATLPEPYASLASGIVIGGKTGLGTDLQNAFVLSGLVQVIVLSGYNVMIVAEWVMYLLGFLKLRRRYAVLAGTVAIILFVAVAGASSTAIRASLMAIIALYARATGRQYAASRALLVVIFLMLAWNPLLLVFDPGFDLSVVATAGLIWLAPLLELKLVRMKNALWRNTVATTLAAQLAVLPLLLYQTGNLSLVAIPANLLVTPAMPLAMAFAALAGFAGMLLGSYAWIVAIPAYLSTGFIIFVAHTSANLPFAAFHLPSFPFVFVLLAYAVLVYIAFSKRASMTDQFTLSKNAST